MDKFYSRVSANKNAVNKGSTVEPYFTVNHNTPSVSYKPQQIPATRMLQRSQQINPEFSEPFDLDSEYSQRAVPTLFRSTSTHDNFTKRQQPYSRPKEPVKTRQFTGQGLFQPQNTSQNYVPNFDPNYCNSRSNSNYATDFKEDYTKNKSTTDFISSAFGTGKNNRSKAVSTFVAANKSEDIKKTFVSKSPQSKNMKMNSLRKRYFIGSIDQVIRWFRLEKQANIIATYEITAILESIQKEKSSKRHILFLRNESGYKSSVLQAVFYNIDRNLPELQAGQLVTCVGRMIGSNKLHVLDIWPTLEDQAGIKRISFLCERTLQEATLSTSDSQ